MQKIKSQAGAPVRSKRTILCEIRYHSLTLSATIREAGPASLSGVHIIETDPPEGGDAVQWYLLTSLWINPVEAAVEVVSFYLQHWCIEDFFWMLKSGCQVEYLAFHTAGRLECAIAVNSVIAWWIMLMTLLGRQVPGLLWPRQTYSYRAELTILSEFHACYGRDPGLSNPALDLFLSPAFRIMV